MVGVRESDGGRGSIGGKLSDGGGGAMELTHLGSSSPVSILGAGHPSCKFVFVGGGSSSFVVVIGLCHCL